MDNLNEIEELKEKVNLLEQKVKLINHLETEVFRLSKQVKKNKNAILFFKISIIISSILLPIFAVIYIMRLLALVSL